jgi:hypothetical protein
LANPNTSHSHCRFFILFKKNLPNLSYFGKALRPLAVIQHQQQLFSISMKNFMMIFHESKDTPQPSNEEFQESIKAWNDWIGGIAAQGKLLGTDALGYEGKTVHADGTQTDGPYAEVKEMIGGYLICKANDLEEAVKMTEGCPMFTVGGKVEVRDVMVFDE